MRLAEAIGGAQHSGQRSGTLTLVCHTHTGSHARISRVPICLLWYETVSQCSLNCL